MVVSDAAMAGFGLGSSLIVAIGPQNAFVLRQGLRGEHVLAVVLFCALSDVLLINAGVHGLSLMLAAAPWLEPLLRYGGGAFLCAYGLRSLLSAWRAEHALVPSADVATPLWSALATCAALTWLNPHVYLDTVLLLGAISTHYAAQINQFALGASLASLVFFFALGYGAGLLRPVFARALSWRILEMLIGLTMWVIAAKVLLRLD